MIAVFAGPSLNAHDGKSILPDAVFLPPAAQGDVYRLTREHPRIIAIIDGYFERVPAVWHKEILLAMSEGIHVYGASSIGALRAAELEPFGMVGAGKIFTAYRDAIIEDDDEVAVIHASEQEQYRALSEPLVNIRATLQRAVEEKIIHGDEGSQLLGIGKSLFYSLRDYPAILGRGLKEGVAAGAIERLRDWLPQHRVDQKHEDAIELLQMIRQDASAPHAPKCVSYVFQRTQIWEEAIRQTGRNQVDTTRENQPGASDLLLDELRLLGARAYHRHRDLALVRVLALDEAARQGLVGGSDEARIDLVRRIFAREAEREIPASLEAEDLFQPLFTRARDKQQLLAHRGLEQPDLESTGLSDRELIEWFFKERRNAALPSDLGEYAKEIGLAGIDVLLQLIRRDYLYRLSSSALTLKREPSS